MAGVSSSDSHVFHLISCSPLHPYLFQNDLQHVSESKSHIAGVHVSVSELDAELEVKREGQGIDVAIAVELRCSEWWAIVY